MKKILLSLLMCFALSVVGMADGFETFKGFYIGGNVGMAGSDNFKDVRDKKKDSGSASDIDLSQSKVFYGGEIGYELPIQPLIDENKLLGMRIGYNWHEPATITLTEVGVGKILDAESSLKNEMQSIPVTLYYKYKFEESKFSILGGLGATFIDMKWTYAGKASIIGITDTESKEKSTSKVCPHIVAGLEYRFTKLLGLSLDLKYIINSEIKYSDDSDYKRELGLQGALAIRFYIF